MIAADVKSTDDDVLFVCRLYNISLYSFCTILESFCTVSILLPHLENNYRKIVPIISDKVKISKIVSSTCVTLGFSGAYISQFYIPVSLKFCPFFPREYIFDNFLVDTRH